MNEMRKLIILMESDLSSDEIVSLNKDTGNWIPSDMRGKEFRVGDVFVMRGGQYKGLTIRTVSKIANNTIYVAGKNNPNKHYKILNVEETCILDR